MDREYQQRDAHELLVRLKTARSVCYQLPTGGGKTWIAGIVAQKMKRKNRSVLALVHCRELVRQFSGTLDKAGLTGEYGVIHGDVPVAPWCKFQVASVQTLVRRINKYKWLRPDLIIVDEAHHAKASTWETVLAAYPQAKLLGLTATPQRYDEQPLDDHFESLYCGPSIRKLVSMGYLAPTKIRYLDQGLSGRVKSGKDYSLKDMDSRVTDKVIANAVKSYHRYCPGARAIFFGVSIRHSQGVAERFVEAGYPAAHVDGTMDDWERDSRIGKFETGEISVLCNFGLVDEGFDVPACTAVLLGRTTQSLSRYLQMCGRAMRPQQGKTALVLDLSGCFWIHGDPGEDRDWDIHEGVRLVETDEEEDPPSKWIDCQQCGRVFLRKLDACPECGWKRPWKTVTEVDTSLRLHTAEPLPGVKPRNKKEENSRRFERLVAAAIRAGATVDTVYDIAMECGISRAHAARTCRHLGLT